MANLIKLTDMDGNTGGGYGHLLHWEVGTRHSIDKDGTSLCSNQVLHAYEYAHTAVLLNGIHGAYKPFRMWECTGGIIINDNGLKCGVKSLQIIKEVDKKDIPIITTDDLIRILILINSAYVYNTYNKFNNINNENDLKFITWAYDYLTNNAANVDYLKHQLRSLVRYPSIDYEVCRWTDTADSAIVYMANRCDTDINVSYLIMRYVNNNYRGIMEEYKCYIDKKATPNE